MKNFIGGAAVALAIIYFICPVDFFPGPVDDTVFLILSVLFNNKMSMKQITQEDKQ